MKNAYNFLPNGFVAGFFKLTRILGRPTSPILNQRRADVKNNVTKFHLYLKKCFARSFLDTIWDYFQLTLAKSTSKLWPKLHLGLDGLSNQKIFKMYTTTQCVVSNYKWKMGQLLAFSEYSNFNTTIIQILPFSQCLRFYGAR